MTKQDGLRLRAQRRARVRRIRTRVIGGSIALFLAVWMLITVVLVTGHDPALARKTLTQTSTPAATTSSSSGTDSAGTSGAATSTAGDSAGFGGSSSSTGSTSAGATSSSTGSGSSGASSVTSSQS